MTPEELKHRMKAFAVQVIRFAEGLPRGRSIDVIAKQLVKAGTSVGANYRAACVGRSRAEFNAKLQIVLEEADESVYWLEVLNESGLGDGPSLAALRQEGKEISAIVMASLKTSRGLR